MEIQWPLLIFSVLLGIASGAFVFLGIGELTGRFKKVRVSGAALALACLAVGGCASAFHLGHPDRVTHLLGNLSSGLSKELFVVAVFGIVIIAYLVLARKNYPTATKVLGVVGMVLGIALPLVAGGSYLMAARPAWDSITLPLMYLGGGLGMGTLLMAGIVAVGDSVEGDRAFALKIALAGVTILVITSLAYVAWIAMAPHPDPSRSIERLVSGDYAAMFWGGVVVVGLAVPAVLTVAALAQVKKAPAEGPAPAAVSGELFAAFACSALGAVVLRMIMYGVGTSVEKFIY